MSWLLAQRLATPQQIAESVVQKVRGTIVAEFAATHDLKSIQLNIRLSASPSQIRKSPDMPTRRTGFHVAALLAMMFVANRCAADSFVRVSPETCGVDSAAMLKFVNALDAQVEGIHSVMVVRYGRVIAEGYWGPYNPESRHVLFSLSKSFTSTAIGIAVSEGKLDIDDPVLKFFPDEAPKEPSENLRAMRIRDLLTMSTGHESEPQSIGVGPSVRNFLAHPVPFKPGTRFLYNTPATYMLSAILQKVTGEKLNDYLKPRLYQPLGIDSPTWDDSAEGVSLGGYGLSVRTEDIGRFGQLYLQRGQWRSKQIVPKAWIEAATSRQIDNGKNPDSDWNQGYGYQFWQSRHGAYRGDGAFGQYCIVIPHADTVIAITGGVSDMQEPLNIVWEELLPELSPVRRPDNYEPPEVAYKQLKAKLAALTLPVVTGTAKPADVAGKIYEFSEPNMPPMSLGIAEMDDKTVTLLVRMRGVEQRIVCGRGHWVKGKSSWGMGDNVPTAACGEWTSADEFSARLCFYETPFMLKVKLKFAEKQLTYNAEFNVGFGPTKQPTRTGTLK